MKRNFSDLSKNIMCNIERERERYIDKNIYLYLHDHTKNNNTVLVVTLTQSVLVLYTTKLSGWAQIQEFDKHIMFHSVAQHSQTHALYS